MVCPFCLHKKTEVYNSRPTKRLNAVWRRRRCLACHQDFTTRELVEIESILKVSKAPRKRSTPFLRAKLLLSIIKVCDHRADQDAAYWLFETIEQRLIKLGASKDGVISPQDIIDACLTTLKPFDTPAFVKYLSYHSTALDNTAIRRQLKK